MKRYMLDTNTISYFIRGHQYVSQHLLRKPVTALSISSITEAELLYGLALRPQAIRLHQLVHECLKRIDVMDWCLPA